MTYDHLIKRNSTVSLRALCNAIFGDGGEDVFDQAIDIIGEDIDGDLYLAPVSEVATALSTSDDDRISDLYDVICDLTDEMLGRPDPGFPIPSVNAYIDLVN